MVSITSASSFILDEQVFATIALNSRFTAATDRATLGRRPCHAPSIVFGTYKHLKLMGFLSAGNGVTVNYAVN